MENLLIRNIFLINLINALRGSVFMLAIIIPYCLAYKDMSIQDFLLSEAIFAATAFLFEIPSGYLSDRWQRKYVLFLSLLFSGVGYLFMVFIPGFFGFTLGNVLIGIACALLSGTDTSIIYDSLVILKREKEYKKHEGRRQGLSLGMAGIASIVGGFAYKVDPHLPFYLGSLACLLGMGASFFIVEPDRQKSDGHHNPLLDMLITVQRCIKKPAMASIILFGGLAFAITKIGMWLQQPYYLEIGIDESWFGILMAGGLLIGWAGGEFADWIERKVSLRLFVILIWFFPMLAFFTAGTWFGFVGVALLVSCSATFGAGKPVLRHELNGRANPTRRATILSTFGLSVQLLFIILSPLIGWVSDHLGLDNAFYVLGVVTLIFGGFSLLFMKREKVI